MLGTPIGALPLSSNHKALLSNAETDEVYLSRDHVTTNSAVGDIVALAYPSLLQNGSANNQSSSTPASTSFRGSAAQIFSYPFRQLQLKSYPQTSSTNHPISSNPLANALKSIGAVSAIDLHPYPSVSPSSSSSPLSSLPKSSWDTFSPIPSLAWQVDRLLSGVGTYTTKAPLTRIISTSAPMQSTPMSPTISMVNSTNPTTSSEHGMQSDIPSGINGLGRGITELAGLPGVGKSQFAMQMCVNGVLPSRIWQILGDCLANLHSKTTPSNNGQLGGSQSGDIYPEVREIRKVLDESYKISDDKQVCLQSIPIDVIEKKTKALALLLKMIKDEVYDVECILSCLFAAVKTTPNVPTSTIHKSTNSHNNNNSTSANKNSDSSCLNPILPPSLFSWNETIFIDTEGSFIAQRVSQIAKGTIYTLREIILDKLDILLYRAKDITDVMTRWIDYSMKGYEERVGSIVNDGLTGSSGDNNTYTSHISTNHDGNSTNYGSNMDYKQGQDEGNESLHESHLEASQGDGYGDGDGKMKTPKRKGGKRKSSKLIKDGDGINDSPTIKTPKSRKHSSRNDSVSSSSVTNDTMAECSSSSRSSGTSDSRSQTGSDIDLHINRVLMSLLNILQSNLQTTAAINFSTTSIMDSSSPSFTSTSLHSTTPSTSSSTPSITTASSFHLSPHYAQITAFSTSLDKSIRQLMMDSTGLLSSHLTSSLIRHILARIHVYRITTAPQLIGLLAHQLHSFVEERNNIMKLMPYYGHHNINPQSTPTSSTTMLSSSSSSSSSSFSSSSTSIASSSPSNLLLPSHSHSGCVRLVAVDSIAFLFRVLNEDTLGLSNISNSGSNYAGPSKNVTAAHRRNVLLSRIGLELNRLSADTGVSVLTTNHVTTKITHKQAKPFLSPNTNTKANDEIDDGEHGKLVESVGLRSETLAPLLGDSWTHHVTRRFMLSWASVTAQSHSNTNHYQTKGVNSYSSSNNQRGGNRRSDEERTVRIMRVIKSPTLSPEHFALYQITTAGVRDID